MRKFILFIICFLSAFDILAQGDISSDKLHIIPQPVSVTEEKGFFRLKSNTGIFATSQEAAESASFLASMLNKPTGYRLKSELTHVVRKDNSIMLRINQKRIGLLGNEGYALKVTPNQIRISANTRDGLFYGLQSLMQILPPAVESRQPVLNEIWQVPCVDIQDYPRFSWRGLMLDVSRHFFSKEFLLRYIDEMVKYKFNVFHLHLTDDQGWRLEILGLPELTSMGAWRVPRMGSWWSFAPPQPGERADYGGYYTQEDIREIVAYAQKRSVIIVPEIDVPAHSLALIAAYPGLSCTKLKYSVNPGSRFNHEDDVLCVANDSTWMVLDKIFTQVAALFPGPYIHVGGDEANRSFWSHHEPDQELMRKEGISDVAGLQSYFTKRLEKLILSKGKKMIGWDEILEGGVAPEATVMSWRGMQGGIKAAGMKHEVIMTPSHYAYLDLYQGEPLVEPETYSMLRLDTCYAFDPLPEGIDSKYILGGQGNLWSESVPNDRQAEYMTWPRGFALAEALWSPTNKRNWPDFVRRVEWRFQYLDEAQVKYARSLYDPVITGLIGADDSIKVKMESEITGIDIRYRFDGTDPDIFSPIYGVRPLDIPKGATQIRVRTFRKGRPLGRQINYPLKELKDKDGNPVKSKS
ncbi:MAG: family 20 glycosylhydrolase [Puia sp.]